ncbi:MAG TPA: isoaspartyl peptidase/L-asparaginase [Woeseiaceae bacterium]|nr:isoaspartyl peptidase/L-asparaginase [Woeseiaceae bacterium]
MNTERFAFALHGGAGARSGRDYSVAEYHMRELTENARDRLAAGARALDVVEYAVAQMETSGLYVAGRGSSANSAGYVELDASIMDGPVSAAGAVSCIRDVVNPVCVARRVMEATPHVMLSGAGALAFARAQGFEEVGDPGKYYTLPIGVNEDEIADKSHGTVGAVALDTRGELAAATSTGGTFGKLEGRVGDTPIIGAGTWADSDVAVSCTGTGEYFIRTGAALAIAYKIKAGASLGQAIDEVLADIRHLGGDGGIIAIDSTGRIEMIYNSAGMKRASTDSGGSVYVATFD